MFPRIALYTGVLFCVLIFAQANASAQCTPTVDCNQNGVADQCDIDLGTSDDCNGNLIPDECDLELATSEDCNLDGIPDECSPGTAELVGIGLAFGGGFGSAVDSTADYAVVGAPDDDLLGTNTGSANIFKRTGTRWAEEMKIFGVSATLEDRFGAAVAIEGDLAAIGAPGKLQGRGAVFLYRRVGNGWWNYEGTLTAFDAPLGAAFGSAIAIENETIFVGAPGTLNGLGSGSVYIFTNENSMWLQDQKLESDELTDGDMLGCSIAVHGGTVAIGAPGHEAGGVTNAGSVLIFEESAGIYTESLMITAETPSPFATFGYSLDVNHDHLLVGAPGENVDGGAAYMHNRLASMWINQQRIEPADADESGLFGADVGLDVKTAVISAPAAGNDQGQVVIYRKSGLDWLREDPLSPLSDRLAGEYYGSSLSCQLPFLIVGSSGENTGNSIWISVYNDCNENLEDDICDVTQGLEADCNMNLIPDNCEISDGTKQDCDGNGVPDECQIASGELIDCNMNGVPDGCDVTSGFSLDCNQDLIPDECQVDADPLLPTIANMPSPFNVSTDPGDCGAVVTWDEPIATDNCGIASLETTHPSGSVFPTGLTIVTYTATDVSGNIRTAMFTVVVTDDELPTLTGFQNVVSVDTSEGICELAVNWPAPTPVDNCGIFSVTSTHQPGDIFPVGTTPVTYTLTDSNGNVSSINLDVVVVDTVDPVITGMPADIDLLTEPGICTRLVEWAEPESSDDCSVASFSSDVASGTVFDLGTTTVTYTVTDGWGNVVSSSFNVTIRDEELPVFTSAPADIVAGNDPGECHAQISWAPAAVQDNCGVGAVISSHQPGDIFPLGDTEVTITATDDNGNVNHHQFTVSILDTEAPLISNVPEDYFLDNDPAQCTAVVNWQLPGISDNCGISVFSGTANSGDAFPIGTTVVEYTLIDNAGNQTNASFSITVNDTEMPILLGLPQDISVFNDLGQCGANVSWDVPTPWDNCELVDFDGSHESGAFFPKGTTEVTYLVMDGMGQVTTGSFNVSVDDDEAPQISGMPADRTIPADAGLCSAVHSWTIPVPSDNCEVVSFTATHEPGETFPVGVTQVSYTVTDSMGMTTTDQFSITVVDNENPQIIRIPADMTLVVGEGECTTPVSWIAPDSQDNCAIDTFSISHASGSDFPVGMTTVEINTADIHGNTSAASFNVTVLDQETPVILNLPADISVNSDGDACGTTVTWVEPQGADNCSVSDLSSDQINGEFYPVGTTVVTYSILDASGNSDEASFSIEVTDSTAPVFTDIPQGIQMSTDPGQCGAVVSWNPVTAADNCAVDTISGSHSSGMTFETGITTVEYLATDIHGNQTIHTFDVEILDQEQPQIIGIDENIVVVNDGGQCGANVSWVQPEATDNCTVDSLTHSIPSGAFFSVGTTQVSYLAVDNSGNETIKSFSVTVEDNENPSFVEIPTLVTGTTTEGTCDGLGVWDEVTGADNCLVDSIILTHASGDVFPLGDTTVTATITDIHGNVHSSDFTVRIEDDELPQLIGTPADQFKINDPSECGAVVDWTIPGTSDNCQVQTFEGTHVPGSFFERGITVVSYTVTDTSGNSYMESFEVNVVDLETPEILGTPTDIVAVADSGSCGTNISWIEPTSDDNCSVQALISSHNPGDFFITGTTVVSYTAQDPTGNISTTQFNVTILDEEFPTFGSFPDSVTVSNDVDQCGASVSWIEPLMLDNCSIGINGSDHQSGDFFPIGTTVVTYEIADASGNTISDSFSVTVEDTQAPDFLTFISSSVLDTDPGECGAIHTWGIPEVLENCPGLEVTSSHNPGDVFSTGLTVVNYTATDAAGHVSTLMFTVIVQDTESPQIMGMPANITQTTDLDECGAVVDWVAPQSSDNCAVLSFTSDHAPGDFFPKGTTTVSYTVVDTAGLTVTESFDVTILDEQAATITAMPQSVTINSQNGLCGSMHAWDLPQSSDNCPDHVFTGSHQPGDLFAVGSTTVAYTAIDSSGNVSSAEFVVTVVDNENPEIVGAPEDLIVIADEGVCSMPVTWDAPTFEDNCGIDTSAISRESGSEFLLGDTLVEITTTDIHGNSAATSFTVTILDQELPQVVNLPADITVENDLDSCGAVVSWIEPTSSDNCEVTSLNGNQINGDTFPIGITVVEYTVVDSSGNTNLASFQIEVLDTQLPELFAMPDSVLQVNDAGECGAVIGWDLPQTSDNCPDQVLTSTHNPGDFFAVGLTTVSYTVTDASGNSRSLSFEIQIVDLEIPVVVNGPQDIVVEAEQGLCGSTISWVEPTATDNCSVFDIKPSNYPGEFFAVGSTLVSYTAIDTTGNIAVHEFTVTVEDTQAPIIDGLTGDILVNTDFNQCDAIVTWTEPTISDNCTVVSANVDIASGTAFPIGTTTVSYTVIDSAGLETVQSFDVTVSDNQMPTIENIPGNVVLSVEPGTCQSLHHWIEPTITDNCPGLTVSASHQPGDSFPVGLTIVSYQAADAHGQTRQVMFTVVVQDDEDPVLAGIPEDVILENDPDQCGAVHQWIEPTSTDNCATVGFNTTHPSGSFFSLGTTEVIYSVSDPSGNQVSASFNVTVVDLQLPEFLTVPETVSLNTDPGVCGAAHHWDLPNVYDNCEEINLASSHQPGDVFPIGTTVVTYTAQDPTGNVVSADFSVTVSDFEDPDFEGIPGTITVHTEEGLCDAAVEWIAPVAVDNCEVQSHSSSHQPGDRFALGQTAVVLSATDIYGNAFTTSFLVIVEDHEAAVISGMPESVTISSIPSFCGASHEWISPTASDNCDTLTPTADYLSGHFFPVGSTTVTYSVTDNSGNSTEESFTVTVEDVEAPAFTAISTDYTVSAEADQCGATVIWPDAEASDNCGVDSITYDRTNGLFLELGDHPVNVTVTDIHGLQTTQQFVITVVDDTAPMIHDLPANIQLIATEGQCGAVATWTEPTATDNCPGRLLANNIPSGSFFLVGETTVSYVSTDASGNTTTETFTVTVVDDQLPTLAGIPDDIVVSNDPGVCGAQVSWTQPAALDNCGIDTHVSSLNPGDLFNLGTTTVEITATDYSGNSVSGSFMVTVEDTEAPAIVNLPENMTVESEFGLCGANVNWIEPFTVDNCETGTLVSDIANGAYLNVGLHEVSYTSTDAHGNVTVESFLIEVVDAETPVILSAPSSVEIQVQDGLCGSIYSWSDVQATDNCGIDSITSTNESGSFFPKGTTLVQQIISDAAGNSVSHEFEVTVVDHESPQFSSSISGISLQSLNGACGANAEWAEPEVSDNCEIVSLTKSHEPGAFFEVGDTLVTYTLLDSSGNESSIDFIVSVEDIEAPVISGLQNTLTVVTDPGFCGAIVHWDAPVITDNCLVDNILSTHQPGEFFPVGNTVVTYSVSDNSELVSSFEFLVTVVDNETPQISNVPSIDLIETDPGQCGATVSWSSPSVTDNCQVTGLTSDIQNGTFLEVGQHTIVFTALDIHGNESTAGFTVTIVDGEAPSITDLPTLVDGVTSSDSCFGTVTWDEPLISDNCGEFSVERSHQSGDLFSLGTTTVTYTATDLQGNSHSANFEVRISDIHGPEISGLPLEISSDTDPDSCLALLSWTEPTIIEHCGDFTLQKSHQPGTAFPVGTTEVIYTATDLSGNVTQVSFPVHVNDIQAPEITLIPEDQTILANEDECSMVANWPSPTAIDNCGVASIFTSHHNSGDLYPVGVTTIEIIATDIHGNVSTASFQINVIDTIDPILTGMPADITTVSDPTICGAEITWVEPSVIENCNLLQVESNYEPGTVFPVGITVVNYVATDISGNSVSASFNVTVIDDEAPTIEIPVPVIIDAPEGSCEVYVEVPQLEVFDRCGVSQITNSFNGTADASGVYPRGETLILWSVSDESGNTSTITGVVSVQVSGPDCNANGTPDVCDIAEDISVDCNLDGVPDECQADCDADGILDVCEIAQGLVLDCDSDGVPDECQIASGIASDCDGDGLIDSCEILTGSGIDCDNSGVLDSCEILQGTVADCNNNGQPDLCDIDLGVESDCNGDGIADACQIASGSEVDCNGDSVIDSCELTNGTASDCNGNGTLDVCDLATGNATDCNQNAIPDSCDIASGIAFDCNANGQLDTCDIEQGLADDCNTNNVPDACDVATGATPDCNSNGIPDSCDLSSGAADDCNGSGIPDSCEVASGATPDCNGNAIPDSCDLANGTADCDGNNVPDSCQVASGESPDCNGNGVPDACDISSGVALDCNDNGVPDSCEVANGQVADCNSNGIPDSCDITSGVESDCNSSGVPDSCEVTSGTALDCNDNGIPDSCDISSGNWQDCDADGNLDSCEILVGTEQDCNGTGIPDACEILSGSANDCDGNQIPDSCDLVTGVLADCDQNGTPDSCDILAGGVDDCNGNLVPDSCDLLTGTLQDCNQNAVPDFCEIAAGDTDDCDANGIPDSCDIAAGILLDANLDGIPDQCQLNFLRGDGNDDGIVNIADGIFLLQSLFADGADSTCNDAADANDDGSVDVSDVISILGYQFNGTNPPPAPYPNCGVDPAGGVNLGCEAYNSCP